MNQVTNLHLKTAKNLILATIVAASAIIGSSSAFAQQFAVGVQLGDNPGYTGLGELNESFTPDAGPGGGDQARGPISLGSGVSFTISDPAVHSGNNYAETETSGSNPSALNLFTSDNVIFGNGNSLIFTFSGLISGANYSLALYAGDLGDRSGDDPVHFTVNGTTETPVGSVYGNNSFVLNTTTSAGNYEIVSTTANSSGDIVIVGSDAGPSNYAEVAGFGLSSAAPEPSTWALVLAGAAVTFGLSVMRRRSNA